MHDLYKALTDDPRLHFLTSELRRTRHQEYEIRVMIAKTDLEAIGDLQAFAKEHGLQGRVEENGAWVELLEVEPGLSPELRTETPAVRRWI
jgi:hypothetical protein